MKRLLRYVLVIGLSFSVMLTFGMTSHLSAEPLPKTIDMAPIRQVPYSTY